MLEIVRTLIERLLGWPMAALVLGILFRKSLARLIDRIDKGKFAGIEVSTNSAIDQLVGATARSATDDQLSTIAPTTPPDGAPPSPPGGPDDLAARRAQVQAFGGNQPLVLNTMQNIAASLEELGFTLETPDTAPVLVRHLAVTQIMHAREMIYRLIFGSQIAALKALISGPKTETELRAMFDKAVSRSPDYFANYKFENWIGVLIQFGVVAQAEGVYVSTALGLEFIQWLALSGLGEKAH